MRHILIVTIALMWASVAEARPLEGRYRGNVPYDKTVFNREVFTESSLKGSSLPANFTITKKNNRYTLVDNSDGSRRPLSKGRYGYTSGGVNGPNRIINGMSCGTIVEVTYRPVNGVVENVVHLYIYCPNGEAVSFFFRKIWR